jgi:hypothetical protein
LIDMKRVFVVAVFLLIGLGVFAANETALRRFAMFVGSNAGGSDRVTLRYAEEDAKRMATVLEELGGVVPGDTLLLLGAGGRELQAGFRRIAERIHEAQPNARRTEFVFYYSGHSDEQGILLGEELLPGPQGLDRRGPGGCEYRHSRLLLLRRLHPAEGWDPAAAVPSR